MKYYIDITRTVYRSRAHHNNNKKKIGKKVKHTTYWVLCVAFNICMFYCIKFKFN